MTSHNTVVLKELDSRTLAISKDYETIEVNSCQNGQNRT